MRSRKVDAPVVKSAFHLQAGAHVSREVLRQALAVRHGRHLECDEVGNRWGVLRRGQRLPRRGSSPLAVRREPLSVADHEPVQHIDAEFAAGVAQGIEEAECVPGFGLISHQEDGIGLLALEPGEQRPDGLANVLGRRKVEALDEADGPLPQGDDDDRVAGVVAEPGTEGGQDVSGAAEPDGVHAATLPAQRSADHRQDAACAQRENAGGGCAQPCCGASSAAGRHQTDRAAVLDSAVQC